MPFRTGVKGAPQNATDALTAGLFLPRTAGFFDGMTCVKTSACVREEAVWKRGKRRIGKRPNKAHLPRVFSSRLRLAFLTVVWLCSGSDAAPGALAEHEALLSSTGMMIACAFRCVWRILFANRGCV
jgi:hypothetical protein